MTELDKAALENAAREVDRVLHGGAHKHCTPFNCGHTGHVHEATAAAILAYQASAPAMGVSEAGRDVLAERRRQIEAEGWTPEHDDKHEAGELARAGAYYAIHWIGYLHPDPISAGEALETAIHSERYDWFHKADCLWPWQPTERNTKDPRRDLVRAAALILAEIERLDRLTAARASTTGEK